MLEYPGGFQIVEDGEASLAVSSVSPVSSHPAHLVTHISQQIHLRAWDHDAGKGTAISGGEASLELLTHSGCAFDILRYLGKEAARRTGCVLPKRPPSSHLFQDRQPFSRI
jgi:hypothetical protein